jgi:hypothetical protein
VTFYIRKLALGDIGELFGRKSLGEIYGMSSSRGVPAPSIMQE